VERIDFHFAGDTRFAERVRSAAISADNRFVVFVGAISAPPHGGTGQVEEDVYVVDRTAHTVERLFPNSSTSFLSFFSVSVSADGRYVAFDSTAANIVPGDANGARDVFVYDRLTRTTRIRSRDRIGAQANGASALLGLSADGRYVGFRSEGANLVAGDTNDVGDVFTRYATAPEILSAGPTTIRISASTTRVVLTGTGFAPETEVSVSDLPNGFDGPTLINPTQLVIGVNTAGGAPEPTQPGPRDIIVANPGTGPGAGTGGSSVCPSCITIVE
jgi:Tol biopolymer transport system component